MNLSIIQCHTCCNLVKICLGYILITIYMINLLLQILRMSQLGSHVLPGSADLFILHLHGLPAGGAVDKPVEQVIDCLLYTSILKDKAAKAREKQIDFSAMVAFNGIDFMEPLDISTIFGNAIDNAMEASEPDVYKRQIFLLYASLLS